MKEKAPDELTFQIHKEIRPMSQTSCILCFLARNVSSYSLGKRSNVHNTLYMIKKRKELNSNKQRIEHTSASAKAVAR
jgi:hypothetical protein